MTLTAATVPGYIAGTWTIDPAHSEVTFSVRHLAISKVKGKFETFDATVVTGETLEQSSVEATVEIASVNTGQEGRDGHLRTGDFFAANEFPTMTFRSTAIRPQNDHVLIDGDLTLRGVTKPVTFTGEFGGITVDGYGQTKAGGEATAKIDRTDFGVNWNTAVDAGGFMLGNDVTITLELQFTLQQ